MNVAYIGVGSNIDPRKHIPAAVADLMPHVNVTACSTFLRTLPLGGPVQPDYANGVIRAETVLAPADLKSLLRRVEAANGRIRSSERYAARTIDLDILVYDAQIVREAGLVIPSPDLLGRAFLLLALHEVAPDLAIPGEERPLAEIVSGLDVSFEPYSDLTELVRRTISGG